MLLLQPFLPCRGPATATVAAGGVLHISPEVRGRTWAEAMFSQWKLFPTHFVHGCAESVGRRKSPGSASATFQARIRLFTRTSRARMITLKTKSARHPVNSSLNSSLIIKASLALLVSSRSAFRRDPRQVQPDQRFSLITSYIRLRWLLLVNHL